MTRQNSRLVLFCQGEAHKFIDYRHISDAACHLTNLFEAPEPVQVGQRIYDNKHIHRSREAEFRQVQEILADRAARERLIRTKNLPRYTFNGFLACGVCSSPLYTHRNTAAEYYVCKRNGTRARKRGEGCSTPYILAGKTEAKIDQLPATRLQDAATLQTIAETYLAGLEEPAGVAGVDLEAGKQLAASLEAKRTRILDSFFEDLISKPERDKRIKAIDAELAGCHEMLASAVTRQPKRPEITADQLAAVLEVFAGFQFLDRAQKKRHRN